jgi:outer membrane protein assembly factor BamB
MTVIELGEMGAAGPEPERRPDGPVLNPRAWRRWAAGGMALLCALVLAASARPEPPMVRQLWEITLGTDYQTTMREDGIFVHQRTGVGAPEIVVYDPSTGAVRWRREFGKVPTYLPMGAESGVVLASSDEQYLEVLLDDGTKGTAVYGGRTTALDSATGAELWSHSGEVQISMPGTVLLGERTADNNLSSLRLVRARDGSTVWQRATPGAHQATIEQDGPEARHIALSDRVGNVTVLRYADGAQLAQARLPWVRSLPNIDTGTYLATAGGLLLVGYQRSTSSEIAAYRIASLERIWSFDASVYAYPQECGPVICVESNNVTHGLDPRDGRSVWTLPGYSSAYRIAGDRLIASTNRPDRTDQVLIDPATGTRVSDVVRGWPLFTGPDRSVIYLLNHFYTPNSATSSVSRLDPRTGRSVRIGVVTDVDGHQCNLTGGRYLACEWGGRISVTTFG